MRRSLKDHNVHPVYRGRLKRLYGAGISHGRSAYGEGAQAMIAEHLIRHEGEHTIIRVRLRNGVWEVSRDGAFFGDYLQRRHAVAAAEAAAAAFQALGGVAEISLPPTAREARRRAKEVAQ